MATSAKSEGMTRISLSILYRTFPESSTTFRRWRDGRPSSKPCTIDFCDYDGLEKRCTLARTCQCVLSFDCTTSIEIITNIPLQNQSKRTRTIWTQFRLGQIRTNLKGRMISIWCIAYTFFQLVFIQYAWWFFLTNNHCSSRHVVHVNIIDFEG